MHSADIERTSRGREGATPDGKRVFPLELAGWLAGCWLLAAGCWLLDAGWLLQLRSLTYPSLFRWVERPSLSTFSRRSRDAASFLDLALSRLISWIALFADTFVHGDGRSMQNVNRR